MCLSEIQDYEPYIQGLWWNINTFRGGFWDIALLSLQRNLTEWLLRECNRKVLSN